VVVATMLDSVQKFPEALKAWQESKKEIRRIFWPESTSSSSDTELLLECSVEVGQSLQELRTLLATAEKKPGLEKIREGSTERVSGGFVEKNH
jgi:hypothetical protein